MHAQGRESEGEKEVHTNSTGRLMVEVSAKTGQSPVEEVSSIVEN